MPFNDAGAMERRIERLIDEGRKPACVIMEAAMMNLGVVLPEPGYLEAVRELTRKHGIVLIFDEVKTGLCDRRRRRDRALRRPARHGHAGQGARRRAPVRRDRRHRGGHATSSRTARVYQVGTYNGNPLSMAAARASLLEVLTPEAYDHLDALNDRILPGCEAVIERHGLPGYAVGIGSKGCVTFSPTKIVDYETFKENQDAELADLAWLYNMNRGIFMTPGPRRGVDALGRPLLRGLRPLCGASRRWRAT